jgi:hypothetical protein
MQLPALADCVDLRWIAGGCRVWSRLVIRRIKVGIPRHDLSNTDQSNRRPTALRYTCGGHCSSCRSKKGRLGIKSLIYSELVSTPPAQHPAWLPQKLNFQNQGVQRDQGHRVFLCAAAYTRRYRANRTVFVAPDRRYRVPGAACSKDTIACADTFFLSACVSAQWVSTFFIIPTPANSEAAFPVGI